MVTTPTPTFLAFSMAICMPFGATTSPSPRSQSMLAVAGLSRTMRQSGVALSAPLP